MPNMGLSAALRMLNLLIDPAWTLQMHATDEIFIEQVARMLSHPNRPDALTCFNDTVAASVYEAARRAGLRVGADLGVIGKDKTFTVGLQAFIQENTTNWVNMAAATAVSYTHLDVYKRQDQVPENAKLIGSVDARSLE